MKETGNRIRKYRHLCNYTQEFMASKIGIDTSNYTRLELGRTSITLQRLHTIAQILKVEPEVLFLNESKLHMLQSAIEMQQNTAILKEEIRYLRLLVSYFENVQRGIIPNESDAPPDKPILNFNGSNGGIYYGSNKYI
jgi:transcriptional regulator with XRE-family HTH domain